VFVDLFLVGFDGLIRKIFALESGISDYDKEGKFGLEKIACNSLMMGIAHEVLFIENGNDDGE
jgi:hypothetical protein